MRLPIEALILSIDPIDTGAALIRGLPRPMSLHDVPESDWKIFRELQQRALEEVQTILGNGSQSPHNRYLDVFRLLQTRDDELAHAFNDPRRSRMIIQLAAIHAYGLLEPDELDRFTERTRATIESLAKEIAR